MKHIFTKTLLASAVATISIGAAHAHSILNGFVPAEPASFNTAETNYDVFRTTCFTDNASSPVGLTDASGNQWTLPFKNGSGSTSATYQLSFAFSPVGSTSYNGDELFVSVAYADAPNVACYTSGNTTVSGQPNLDSYCTDGTNANNILPALNSTEEVTTISSSTFSSEWETVASNPDNQPPISATKLLSPLGSGSLSGWVWGKLHPKGIDQTAGVGTNANGEYVIVVYNASGNNHSYDFIAHCTDAKGPSHPNSKIDPTYHTGQGAQWIVNSPGTSGAYLSEGTDYDQVINDGVNH